MSQNTIILASVFLGALLPAPGYAQVLSGGGLTLLGGGPVSAGGAALSGGSFGLLQTLGAVTTGGGSAGSLSLTSGIFGLTPSASLTLDSLHAFPVPFRPSLGHTRITFRGTTARTTLRIYTLSGWLVRTLYKNDAATEDLVWYPVVNSAGQAMASGVYPYYAEGDGGRRRWGKLMIIK